MKVKLFSYHEKDLIEQRINTFIDGNDIEIIDIKFSMAVTSFNVLIMYEETNNEHN